MELICIACPNGCHLTAERTEQGIVIRNNKCPKGEKYGREEITDPRRTITAVVRTSSKEYPCAPVKTTIPVPKDKIMQVIDQIYKVKVDLPVTSGRTAPVTLSGIDSAIVFTRTLPPEEDGR